MKEKTKGAIIYCIGLFIMSMGVAFSIISNLGVSPISSIPYVVSVLTAVDIGVCTTIFMSFLILVQLLILRRDFKLIFILQLISSVIFGYFVSFSTNLTSAIDLGGNYWLSLLFCGISVVMIGFGLCLYLAPKFIVLPGEGVMQAMTNKFNLPMYVCKTIFDCCVVIIAFILAVVFSGALFGVGEGTIIAALCVGVVLKFFQNLLLAPISRFIGSDARCKEKKESIETENANIN